MKILLMGEPMGLFMAEEPGPLHRAGRFLASIAGAEYNVAVGLARLGHTPAYCTRLGDDPMGARILEGLRANGIDTGLVTLAKGGQTGLMLKSAALQGDPDIAYYRKGSAASQITPQDIDALDLSGIGWVHITGVFPAVSGQALAAVRRLIGRATALSLPISFDPNLRPQLWASQEEMAGTLNQLAQAAGTVLPGAGEGKLLAGAESPQAIAAFYHAMGAENVVVKLGAGGAFWSRRDGASGLEPGFPVETVVDTVGAGDGFAAGVISALAEGLTLREAARRGNAIGAIQISHKSDNEGLPTRPQLEAVLAAGRVPPPSAV